MSQQHISISVFKSFFLEFLGDIAYFPVWWYTIGLKQAALTVVRGIAQTAKNLALRLLVLNIFRPMFGQYDRAGRLISFFMRIIILAGRLVYFVIIAFFYVLYLAIWVLTPLFVVVRILHIYFT